jgi:hypothetical protein
MITYRTGTFTNSNGDTFSVKGVPFLLFQEMREAQKKRWEKEGKELPKIPTYHTDIGEIDWDYKSVMKDGTEEEKSAWKEYVKAFNEFETELDTRRLDVCAMHITGEPNEDKDWVDMMEVAGIEIPEHENARKLLYFRTKVMAKKSETSIENDATRLFILVQGLSGIINEETAQAFERSFRDTLERNKSGRTNHRRTRKARKLDGKQVI